MESDFGHKRIVESVTGEFILISDLRKALDEIEDLRKNILDLKEKIIKQDEFTIVKLTPNK